MLEVEIIAVIATLICVYLTTKENTLCWPIGMVGCLAFALLFWSEKLYLQGSLQFVFFAQSIYGWIYWSWNDKGAGKLGDMMVVNELGQKKVSTHIGIALVIAFLAYCYLYYRTDSPLPLLDSITTMLSLLATYYLIYKHIEAWYIWMLVNLLLFITCMMSELWWTAGMEIILLLLSMKGLFEWKKSLRTESV